MWSGCNAPAIGRCDGSEACRTTCRQTCIHAEQTVIIQAGRANGRGPVGAELLHIKVVPCEEGTLLGKLGVQRYKLAHSGPPSCAECSKLILAAGVAGVWLFHEGGWQRYEAADFHRRTVETLGLYRA
jgi:deoxycytidylate deaminase